MDRTSRPTDHYPPQPSAATTGHPHHHAQSLPGAAPSSFPPHNSSVSHFDAVVAPHHSTRPTLPRVHHHSTGPSQQQHYPSNGPHGPPMQFPNTSVKTDNPPEHAYSADRSGHVTPLTRHSSEFPPLPPQRTPSTPAQTHHLPPNHTADRPMEGAPHGYSVPPDQTPQYAAPYHPQGPSLPPVVHAEQQQLQHHLQPVVDPNGYGHAQGPYGGPAYPYYAAIQAQNANKRKTARAQRACDKCRERKSRCDEERPCSSCRENNIECNYRDGQPAKVSEKNVGAVVTDALDNISSKLETLVNRMTTLEDMINAQAVSPRVKTEGNRPRRDTPAGDTTSNRPDIEMSQDNKTPLIGAPPRLEPRKAKAVVEEDEAASFDEHTTAAHKLITFWPSIYSLLKATSGEPPAPSYVDECEARGPLRLYGNGEADESGESGAFNAPSPAHSNGSEDMGGSTPPDTWGPVPSSMNEVKRSEPYSTGGLLADGRADLHSHTVDRLVKNYKEHIHKLHPFLDLSTLGKFIEKFMMMYSPDKAPQSPFIGTNGDSFARPAKRLRSEPNIFSGPPTGESGSMSSQASKRTPHRSLSIAIVYLILALGKVCEHKGLMPGPLEDTRPQQMAPPLNVSSGYNYASPGTKPSPMSPHSSAFASTPQSGDSRHVHRSRRNSLDGTQGFDRRTDNVDRIPGLGYYRHAVSILGDFLDTNELGCAQARLLAGLYKGQMARVQESWSHYHDAARICRYWIKKQRLDKRGPGQKVHDPKGRDARKENLILLVSWSCLQLESDILAEMDYPHSGLSQYEEQLPYPSNVGDEETWPSNAFRDQVDLYYSAQLFLRKRLNTIHRNLYSPQVSLKTGSEMEFYLLDNEETIIQWRNIKSPINSVWNEDDPPSEDILIARLRAKYYGAWYVCTRPYLDYALHVMDKYRAGVKLEKATVDAKGNPRPSELALFRGISRMEEWRIKDKARLCVRMAIRSTEALDAVPERLIVTNIMGTAHAQFGNMLVLSAVWHSQVAWLADLINERKLRELFCRTVKFLRRLRYCSRTAMADVEILQTIHRSLFGYSVSIDEGRRSEVPNMPFTSSFSSDL